MSNLAYTDDYKERFELIDGKIIMMSPRPRIAHSRALGNIFREFSIYLKGKKCEAFADGVDVYLDEKNHFIPDVMIICNKDIITDLNIQGAPDLVVEVLSPSTAKNDKGIKKDIYEKFGVKEYWIVNTIDKSVEVYLNNNGRFYLDNVYVYFTDEEIAENDALANDDKNKLTIYTDIKVSVCDNLVIKIKDIFENI